MYKKSIFTILLIILGTSSLFAEQWDQLSDEEIQEFRQYVKIKKSRNKERTSISGSTLGASGFTSYGSHSENYDVSLGFSLETTDSTLPTNFLSFILRGQMKSKQDEKLSTTFGIIGSTTSGKLSGNTIDSSYELGLTTGIEYKLNNHIYFETGLLLLSYESLTINNLSITGYNVADRLLISVKYVY
jgi:hypothetical protein